MTRDDGVRRVASGRPDEARASALWGRKGKLLAALCGVLAAPLLAPSAALSAAYVHPPLLERAERNPAASFQVIVVAETGVPASKLRNETLRHRGTSLGDVSRVFRVIPALAVELTGSQLLELAEDGDVASITPDGELIGTGDGDAPEQVWREAMRVAELNATTAGLRVPAIALVDSGVQDGHAAFGGRVSVKRNLSSLQTSVSGGDELGHGTLVAGIAAGSGEYPGVSPTSKIVSLRVLNREGRSSSSDVLMAADWLYRHALSEGIRVANFSIVSINPDLGLFDPINLAVEQLWRRGIVVVAAAGNHGPGHMLFAPASSPFAITVGATDTNGTAATDDDFNAPWSGYGYTGEGFAKPELAAPGRYMVGPVAKGSVLETMFSDRLVGRDWIWMSGTSFAAPVVSGAAAQILARHPDWTPDQVKGALMATARSLPLADSGSVGVGTIDPVAATSLAEAPDGNAHLAPFAERERNAVLFDRDAWVAVAIDDPSWAEASWAKASWAQASWAKASWANETWSSASWASASWAKASWANATWASASWAKASWASASWAKASWAKGIAVE
ncbi:MAG TPA: S8 family serine peptidase [Gaiellaceae bacterium]|nr:S8 family serine peptidase [Gaiellaceae bacterium]